MSLVVGYDGGDSAQRALDAAIVIARDLGDRLVVTCGVGPAGTVGEEYRETEQAVIEALAPIVDDAVARARAAGVEAESLLVDAHPVEAILTAAETHGARMVIVGYGASGRIRAALFGAVAPRMLEEADVPVLVVP
jgi:nucleotide-binding universal stress UspA family protein